MSGAAVLQVLVSATHRDQADPDLEPACSAIRVAHALGYHDGRSVARTLGRLCEEGLATSGCRTRRLKSGGLKVYTGSVVYSPTARGRDVDALLASATASRGGIFRPRNELGLSVSEELALR